MDRVPSNLIDQPELTHSLKLPTSEPRRTGAPIPCSKSEEEIERHWEYLKLMGRNQ